MITRECRRACSALGADGASVRIGAVEQTMQQARLRALPYARRQFGYRRLNILFKRERIIMNHKELRRLYREEQLQVRRRGWTQASARDLVPMVLPQGPNQRGARTSYRTRHDASLSKAV